MIGDAHSMLIGHRQPEPGGAVAPLVVADDLLHRCAHHFSTVLLGLGALSAAGLLALALLGGARPTWWRDVPFTPGQPDRLALAGAVDNGAWTVVTQVRPMTGNAEGDRPSVSEPWSVSLTAEGATAWLNEKLPRWLVTQGHPARLPEGAEMQAAFEPGVVRLGVRIPTGDEGEGRARFVSLALRPRIDADGLWLPAASASVGRLDVPVSVLFADPPGELAAILQGRAPAIRSASLRLPDGRRVRLLRFESIDDRLVLTMQTESAQ